MLNILKTAIVIIPKNIRSLGILNNSREGGPIIIFPLVYIVLVTEIYIMYENTRDEIIK